MHILLVNPLSSAKYLSAALKALKISATAIFTRGEQGYDAYTKPDPEHFDRQIFCRPDAAAIVALLGDDEFDFVLNGSESTVRLTDELASLLTPGRGNDVSSSCSRSDKARVQRRLETAGLRFIRQALAMPDERSVRTAHEQAGFGYPFFLKPLKGVGSKGASAISSSEALGAYFSGARLDALRQDLTVFCEGDPLDRFIVSELIEGDEYFVDSFSLEGKHYISSIQRYRKANVAGMPLYRYFEVVQEPAVHDRIRRYLTDCLNALGYRNGFAHSELFLDADGPVLIELNPRIGGLRGATNLNAQCCELPTQPELLAAALAGEPLRNRFEARDERRYARALTLFGSNHTPFPDLRESLRGYTSVSRIDPLCRPGHIRAHEPASLSDVMAIVICAGHDASIIEQDSAAILERDERGW